MHKQQQQQPLSYCVLVSTIHIVLIKFQVSHGENHHDDGVCAMKETRHTRQDIKENL